MPDRMTPVAAGNRAKMGIYDETTGLAAGTPVLTLDGDLPVEHLCPGDRIVTRDGTRRLRALHVRLLHDVPVVRVAPRALGHGRPESALTLLPGQPVLLRDWRAKALYGTDRAMVPARRLTDGTYMRAETEDRLRLFTLDLGAPAVIYAGDLELGIVPATALA